MPPLWVGVKITTPATAAYCPTAVDMEITCATLYIVAILGAELSRYASDLKELSLAVTTLKQVMKMLIHSYCTAPSLSLQCPIWLFLNWPFSMHGISFPNQKLPAFSPFHIQIPQDPFLMLTKSQSAMTFLLYQTI